jgi:hypothetical protein
MSDARKHTKHTKTHKTYVLVCARARAYPGQLYSKVAEIRGYPRAAFKLTLDDAVVVEEEDGARRLGDVLLERGTSFLKMALKRSPDYASSEHDHLFDTGGANTHTHTAPASSLTVSISKSAAARPGCAGGATKFCGLSNQGATCYMNSLLQSLYMTPEFREGVYKIPVETNIAKQRESICFQLQCLFASMQLSGESAVETKGLTHSFGWSGSEAFQQHDVQELCRVLFDELESRLKDTREADLINDLFEGHMDSYVRNTAGGAVAFESIKSEAFMDISLSIKEFGQARTRSPKPLPLLTKPLPLLTKPLPLLSKSSGRRERDLLNLCLY